MMEKSPSLCRRISRRLLLALLGATLVPATAVVWVAANRASQSAYDETARMLRIQAADARREINGFVHHLRSMVAQASQDPRLRDLLLNTGRASGGRDTLSQFLSAAVSAYFPSARETFVIDPAGAVIASSVPGRIGNDCSASDYFTKGSQSAFVSDVRFDPVIGEHSWVFAAPVKSADNGALLGVLVLRIDPGVVATITVTPSPDGQNEDDRIPVVSRARIYIVSRGGEMMTDSIHRQTIDTKAVRIARRSGTVWAGSYPSPLRRGTVVLGAAVPIPELDWVVVVEIDDDAVMAAAIPFKKTLYALGGASILFAFFVAMLVIWSSLKPVRALVHAEETLVAGDRSAALMPEDVSLDKNTLTLIRNRNRVIHQVLHAEQRYHGLVDEIDGIAWEAEVGSWRFLFVNHRAEAILGYPCEQWLSEPGFWVKHLHPVDRSRAVQTYLEASIAGKDVALDYRMLAADGRAVWLHDRARLLEGQAIVDGRPVRIFRGLMTDVSVSHQARESLRDSERRSRLVIEASRDAIVATDSAGHVTIFNPAAERMFLIPAHEMLGSPTTRLVPEAYRDRHNRGIEHYLETGHTTGVMGSTTELEGLKSDGTVFPIKISLTRTGEKTLRVVAVIKDITEKKRAREELQRQFQQIEVTNQLIDALVDAGSIDQLYQRTLDNVQKALGTSRAAIGLFDPDGMMRYKSSVRLSETYRQMTEAAMPWPVIDAAPEPMVVEDTQSDQRYASLRTAMLNEGIVAMAAIPLVSRGQSLGRLFLYHDEPHQFGPEEMRLAQTIAGHVALAIARKRSDDIMQAIVTGSSATTGADFFRALVLHLASALGVRWAFVGESVGHGGDRVRTIALWNKDQFAENFEYNLDGTPCQGVMGHARCCYPSGVAASFPRDPLLAQMGAESYLGVRLSDAEGKSLGILVVMHDAPMTESSQVQAILTIFAARASAELEHWQKAIHISEQLTEVAQPTVGV